MATATFTHSTIGSIKGNTSNESIIQFLGLQYATATDRFAPAKIKEYPNNNETIDATKIG
jgi:hypothetical protein